MKQLLLYLALASAAAWILVLVFAKPHIGYYYPYSDDVTIFEQSNGSVGTFQDCRWWAYRVHQERDNKDARYSCGTGCQYDENQEYYKCKDAGRIKEIDVIKSIE